MAFACKRQIVLSETFHSVTTEHYKVLCITLLRDWAKLTRQKTERRQSLLTR